MISFSSTADQGSQVAFLAAAPTTAPAAPSIAPNTASGTPTGTAARFTALNTDGSRVLVTTFGHIQVFDTATGVAIDIGDTDALLPAGKLVTHPEWSPSGLRVAFTLYSSEITSGGSTKSVTDSRPEDGEIVTLELDRDDRPRDHPAPHRGHDPGRRAVSFLSRAGRPTSTGW